MTVETLNVLLVEDQQTNIEAWDDKAKAHNADSAAKGFSVASFYAKSVAEAQSVLSAHKVDAVVVDLRLQTDQGKQGTPNDHGNALMKYVAAEHPVAMAVYSGQAKEADTADFPQVEVFDRGDGLNPVFDWLGKQREMIGQIKKTRDAIEREIARIFFRSIWPRWGRWTKKGVNAELSDALARHVVAHVHDSLLYLGGENAHPEETYFIPPLKDRLDTGDLVKMGEKMWIVVSPRCDLANTKVPSVLIAHCKDIKQEWNEAKKIEVKKAMLQHNKSPKWHFLPPLLHADDTEIGPWFVEFGNLQVVPENELEERLNKNRFASLAPQFVPSLVERFGAYFSRIGTPNLSSD